MNATRPVESVLVYVGFDRVGDGLLKLPFVRGLRAAFPKARITWVAGLETSVYAGVMAGVAKGLIDEIVEHAGIGQSPLEFLQGRPKGRLAGRRFDLVIDTQRIFWTTLSLWRVPHDEFISPAARFLLSSKKPQSGYRFPKTMQRQLLDLLEIASGREFPTPKTLTLDIDGKLKEAAARFLPAGPRYLGIAPGSGGPPKCWPIENFIALARDQSAKGQTPVFFLGPKERDWRSAIQAAVPGALFPLQDEAAQRDFGFSPLFTIALGERLALAVSNDSGAAHMLAVAGRPVVILYGPTRPDKFQPMTEMLVALHARDFGGREMRLIPVEAVTEALDAAARKDA